jgi:hypothetical protein
MVKVFVATLTTDLKEYWKSGTDESVGKETMVNDV